MTHGSAPVGGAPTARPMVARYLGLARAAAEQTAEALMLVSERHERDYEVAQGSSLLAAWVREDLDAMRPLEERYGSHGNDQPEKLRSALLDGTRVGGPGLLADLSDLAILYEQMQMTWTILFQGSKELHDPELGTTASSARAHTERGIRWLRTQIEHAAPETLAVSPDASRS